MNGDSGEKSACSACTVFSTERWAASDPYHRVGYGRIIATLLQTMSAVSGRWVTCSQPCWGRNCAEGEQLESGSPPVMLLCKPGKILPLHSVTLESTGLKWVSESRNPGDRSTRQVGRRTPGMGAVAKTGSAPDHMRAKRMKIWRYLR